MKITLRGELRRPRRQLQRLVGQSFGGTMKENWLEDIEGALKICVDDDNAARLIMQCLHDNHRVTFGPACLPWIRCLVCKWRSKTPDVKQQADSIAGAIFKRLVPNNAIFPNDSNDVTKKEVEK